MRKIIATALAVGLLLTACEKATIGGDEGKTKLRFIPTTADVTRGEVRIGDYFTKLNVQLFTPEGEKVFSQMKTQTVDDADFGTLSVGLAAGRYTVVAVGHSSIRSATIKSPEMVQFTASDGEKLTDTFCHCGEVTIGEESGIHELRMNRVCAMVRFRLTDEEVPDGFMKLKIDYTGGSANFNPSTSEGTTKSTQSELRPKASEYRVFTFPYMAATGALKMTLSALTDEGTVLAQKVIESVPVTRNRITTYTGHLFDDSVGEITQQGFGITINTEWDGEDFFEF